MGLRVGRLSRVDRALRLPAMGWAAVLEGQIQVLVEGLAFGWWQLFKRWYFSEHCSDGF